MSDDVRAFSSVYALGPGWTAGAVKLVEVRHKHLAHPGEPMSRADRAALGKGGTGAQAIVDTALRALLEHRLGNVLPLPPEPDAEEADSNEGGQVVMRWAPGRQLHGASSTKESIGPSH